LSLSSLPLPLSLSLSLSLSSSSFMSLSKSSHYGDAEKDVMPEKIEIAYGDIES